MIHVLATIQVHSGQRDAFLAELNGIVPLVHAEQGCLEYGPAVDIESRIPVQAAPRDNVVVIIERWESMEALTAHLSAQHMVDYRVRVRDYVDWLDLRILAPA
ncbi:MAG: putative quinol monooxygenase [Planctomycetaceae bacterium]